MRSLRTLVLIIVLSMATLASTQAQTVRALSDQSRVQPDQEVFRRLVTIQMIESLQHPLAMVRSQTIKNAIVYSTLHRDGVELPSVISAIADVAKRDDSYMNRRLAVAALKSIDSYRAAQYLARLDEMDDGQYRSLIAGVISEYRETRGSQRL